MATPAESTMMVPSAVRHKAGDKRASVFHGEPNVQPEDIGVLIAEVREGFRSGKTRSLEWRRQQLLQFRKMINENEQEFLEAIRSDIGRSYIESDIAELSVIRNEIKYMLKHLGRFMKKQKRSVSLLNFGASAYTLKEPLGVALILGANNYNVHLTLAPVVGAIAAGNCAVVKPGSYAAATSHAMVRLGSLYFDQECIRFVEGNRLITQALLAERFDKIFFTGSTFVGRIVARAAAEHLTPVTLELGGKSPVIVDKSADLQHAAKRIIWGAFMNAGQTCVRPDFGLVHKDVADKFFRECVKAMETFYGKDPKTSEWVARVINAQAYERMASMIEQEREFIVKGGDHDSEGNYVEPTLFDFGTDLEHFTKSPLMEDEIFGPLLAFCRFDDLDWVLDFVNNLPTGKPLALYSFGKASKFNDAIKRGTSSGGLCLNDTMMHLPEESIPFGGVGNSGMGSYHGRYSFECFSHEKAIIERSQAFDNLPGLKRILDARFPPYTNFKQRILNVVSGAPSWTRLHRMPEQPTI